MEKIKHLLGSRNFWGVIGSIAVMALVAFLYFYPDAMQGNTLRQHDVQQGIAIGQETKAYAEATGVHSRWTGSLFSGMPTFQISPDYPSNDMFRWIGSVMSLGLPEPAGLLFMMMIGFFILLMTMRMRWYVALIGAIAYAFSSYFIIIIGAGHIWKFITLAYVPPTIAGVILAYRGRYLAGGALAALFAMMQIAGNHVQMTYYFMFVIGAVSIACLVKAIRTSKIRQWIVATLVLAAAGGLAVVANLPGLYNTYEYSKETMRGGHSELKADDNSETASTGLNRDYITQYSYEPSETFSLLIPNIKGGASNKPEKGGNKSMNLSDLPLAKEMIQKGSLSAEEANYLQYMSQYFGDPEGTNGPVYVGALIVAFFLLGCAIVKGPLKWALVVMTVFSILLALGRHFMGLTNLMIDYMPMYSKFRTVESILVIAEFTMPLLAAMALQKILTADSPSLFWKQNKKAVLWSFGITLGICLIAIIMPSIFGDAVVERDRMFADYITQSLQANGADAATLQYFSLDNPRIYAAVEGLRHSMLEADALRSFLIVAAGLGILLLYFTNKIKTAVTAALLGVIVLGDLYLINKRYVDHDSFVPRQLARGEMFPLSENDKLILADTTANYRVMNIPEFWQAAPSYRHKAIGGYHAAKLTRYQDMIDKHLGNFLNGSETDADWNVLNMLNARYIIDMTGKVHLNPEAMGNAWFVNEVQYVDGADAEMDALSTISPDSVAVSDSRFKQILGSSAPKSAGDTIRLTHYSPNSLTYHAESQKGGVAVLSEVYFPWGWNATLDGKPVEIGRVNYILRAVNIPAGSHTLQLTFDPKSLHTTTAAARVAIIIIYLACIAALIPSIIRKPKKANVNDKPDA